MRPAVRRWGKNFSRKFFSQAPDRLIMVDRMGIEPIDSDLARITRNPITQP